MGSEWAKEADQQAEAMTREFGSPAREIRITYQRREARFALKMAGGTMYFLAHDYEGRKGINWRQLRADILAQIERAGGEQL